MAARVRLQGGPEDSRKRAGASIILFRAKVEFALCDAWLFSEKDGEKREIGRCASRATVTTAAEIDARARRLRNLFDGSRPSCRGSDFDASGGPPRGGGVARVGRPPLHEKAGVSYFGKRRGQEEELAARALRRGERLSTIRNSYSVPEPAASLSATRNRQKQQRIKLSAGQICASAPRTAFRFEVLRDCRCAAGL